MKIASWNVNSLRVRLNHVMDFLEREQPDVLALQEIKVVDAQFPLQAFESMGYHALYCGQKTYNGVALISREPLSSATYLNPLLPTDLPDEKRFITANMGDTHIINVYVPNGAALDSDKYPYKLRWLQALNDYIASALSQYSQLIVLGDFNIAPDDRDVHEPDLWHGGILVSPAERQALQSLLDLGLHDVFRLFPQADKLFSWWDYRAMSFQRNRGLRIDLILASHALQTHCESSHIDKSMRKLTQPSDHAPVIAHFNFAQHV
jgi:exodeoxyribonuclease-3